MNKNQVQVIYSELDSDTDTDIDIDTDNKTGPQRKKRELARLQLHARSKSTRVNDMQSARKNIRGNNYSHSKKAVRPCFDGFDPFGNALISVP